MNAEFKSTNATAFFGLVNCPDPNHCIEILFYIVFSLSILFLILTVIVIIFMCIITIQNTRNTQSISTDNLTTLNPISSNHKQVYRDTNREPVRHLSIRSSSISLASESEKSDDYDYSANQELKSQTHWVF